MKRCNRCGKIVDNDVNYCPNCGLTYFSSCDTGTNTDPHAETYKENKPEYGKQNTATEPKRRNIRLIIAGIAAVAAVLISVLVLVFIFEASYETVYLVTSVVHYYSNGDKEGENLEYDGFNILTDTRWQEFDGEYTNVLKVTYSYDEEERLRQKYNEYSNGNAYISEEYTYDMDNHYVFYSLYDSEGNTSSEYVYTCDKYGNQLDFISLKGKYVWYEYIYDESGNPVKRVSYNDDGGIKRYFEYDYDREGNCIKTTEYDGEGNVKNWAECEFDENNNCVNTVSYGQDGNIEDRTEYTWDDNGNLILEVSYNGDGEIEQKIEYTYDDLGNNILTTEYPYSIVEVYTFYVNTYDENGNLLLSDTYVKIASNDYHNYLEYDYDENDRVIRIKSYTSYDESGWIVEYGYDKNGNIITYLYYDIDGELISQTEFTYIPVDMPSDRADAVKQDQETRLIEWTGYQ